LGRTSQIAADNAIRSSEQLPLGWVAAVALLLGVASLTSITTPVLLHTMQQIVPGGEIALSTTAAGTAMTAELLAMAVSTMAASRLFPLGRGIAVAGCLGAIVLTALSGRLLPDVLSFTLCRLGTGLCIGLVAAGANSQLSISPTPDRLSAFGVIGTTLLGVVGLLALPIIGDQYGPVAVFDALSCIYGFGLLLALRMRPVEAVSGARRQHKASYSWGLIAALCLLNLGDSMIYSASEVMARKAGLAENVYSVVLAVAAIAGVAAAGLAASLSVRIGRRTPVAGALLLKGVASLAVVFVIGVVNFSIVTILVAISHFFALPFLFGAAAQSDRSGRTAVLGAGAFQIGGAIGPLIAAGLLSQSGTLAVGLASAICLFGAWRAGHVPLVRLDRPMSVGA